MPKIQVTFQGALRCPFEGRRAALDLEQEATVDDLLTQCGFAAHEKLRITVLINGVNSSRDRLLVEGDEVALAIMLGGG